MRPWAWAWLGCCAALCARGAAAQPEPAETTLRVAVIGDLNERYGDQFYRDTVHAAVGRLQALEPDLVLIAGDMVAGQRPGLDYEGMWAAFDVNVREPLAGVPVAVTPGNHDASAYSRYAEERVIYRAHFADPEWLTRHPSVSLVESADYPFRYAFTLGPVLFVALDATSRNAMTREQLEWLEHVLGSVDREAYPVRVLFGHFPLLPFTQGRERDYLLGEPALRERFARLVREQGVTAYVSGHHHGYYPGRDPQTGLLLLGTGVLGGGPRVLLGDDREILDTDDPRERTFTVLELDASGVCGLVTYRGPTFEESVEATSLVEQVGEGELIIERYDRGQ